MAKLSVNAMIGLWARSTGGMVWDFVYARRLLSNSTYRPIHDAVLGFEHCMVAKARRILDAPPRYLAQVKTDCLLRSGCRSASRSGCGRWRRCATRTARRTIVARLRDGPLGAQVRAWGQRAKAGLAGGGGDHAAGQPAWG